MLPIEKSDWELFANVSLCNILKGSLPFPPGNYTGCQAIAHQIDSGTRHVHQFIDPQNDEYGLYGKPETAGRRE
jgi:hypothetical protein